MKDDFFDTLSCDAIKGNEGSGDRRRFSEQVKLDSEVRGAIHSPALIAASGGSQTYESSCGALISCLANHSLPVAHVRL